MDTDDRSVSHIGADDADLQPGEAVGEYVIADKIGEGGFGAVFRAEHPLIGKQVAIKVLNRRYSSDPQMVSRFVAEARAVNQIRHRYIIDIFGFGQLPDGRHYYVMEYLEGKPLDQLIEQSGPLPLGEAVAILRGVARALDAAHAKGIAHRDHKPENIFIVIDEQGGAHPKLLDFGIAKLLSQTGSQPMFKTRTGAPIGTPYYMSPEQCRGRDVDHRTDIYAFGCVTYRMLTATFPFDGEDYMEILMKQISNEPIPASSLVAGISPEVDEAISWMLRKDPAARPPNLVTAVRSLEQAAAAAGVNVPVDQAQSAQFGARTGPMGGASRTPSSVAPLPRSGGADAMADTIGSVDAATPVPTMAPERRRGGLWIALALLVVAGGGGAFAFMKMQEGKKKEAAAAPTPTPTPTPTPSPSPSTSTSTIPEEPKFATLTIEGAPAGAEVYGPLGLIGMVPRVQVPRGEEPLMLTLKAEGYQPATIEVTPSEDRAIEVDLKKVAAAAPPKKRGGKRAGKGGEGDQGSRPPGDDTIEDPFGQ